MGAQTMEAQCHTESSDHARGTGLRGEELVVINTAQIREFLDKRDQINQQLIALFSGGNERKQQCSKCGSDEHNARPEKAE